MLRFSTLVLVFLAALPLSGQAGETLQFRVELSLHGCIVTKELSSCDASNELIREDISMDLECLSVRDGKCELLSGRFQKDYLLHWTERGQDRVVRLNASVSKPGGSDTYIVNFHVIPSGGEENDDRSSNVLIKDFRALDSLSILGKTEFTVIDENRTRTLWHSMDASDFRLYLEN